MSVKHGTDTYLRKLYDSFRVRDLTFTEFKRRYLMATSPQLMRHDLTECIDSIQKGRVRKLAIDRSMKQ